MKNGNKKMTKEEALALFASDDGMDWIGSDHNKKMMIEVAMGKMDELRKEKKNDLIIRYAPLMVQPIITIEDDKDDEDTIIECIRVNGINEKVNYIGDDDEKLSAAQAIAHTACILAEALADRVVSITMGRSADYAEGALKSQRIPK